MALLEPVALAVHFEYVDVVGESVEESTGKVLIGTRLRFKWIGLETGLSCQWLYGGLRTRELPAIRVEARQMKASTSAMRNKTDKHDARGIAQMMRDSLFRAVHVKSRDSHERRLLLTNRSLRERTCLDIENEIRGTLKVFGLKVGCVTKSTFDRRVRELVDGA